MIARVFRLYTYEHVYPVSDDTKQMLESLKRGEKAFDELLEGLQSEKPINISAWSEEQGDRAREAVERSRKSSER